MGQPIGVVSPLFGAGAQLRIAEVGQIGVVELKITATRPIERVDFSTITAGQI